MIADHLIEILRCPQDRSQLHLADAELVAKLNRAIAAGELKSVAGETFEKPLDGGLIRAAGDLLYPIIDEIPVMLPDEAVDLRTFQ
ncbi:MAG: hypothetical protein C0485_13865 [Pirellula sp.]|nr:hypothetical protein [Pirellula sp.]